ncbi:hypothetical protein EXIGLDRAFT_271926 [Exidia glandulosa HHB12029]|uniref:Low temperature requirement A n=1 Tax=Exidia glandulosa HHB12029 TaxID=1314781 RepID=A0A165DMD0_EXIGL|nr:hypothetical protein EXIGLDRAFT_271926 [Exidia glandulosa HHB12029]
MPTSSLSTSTSEAKKRKPPTAPFRRDPFQELPAEEDAVVSSQPKWIELFYDLAWTMTFAGLNSGTAPKGPLTVGSYIVFFTLVWAMWLQQTIYHTNFYTSDAYHRAVLLMQFIMLGFIAAFTDDFDVSLGITAASNDQQAIVKETYGLRGFHALSIIFFLSRLLLVASYLDVWRRGRRIAAADVKHVLRYVVMLSLSAALFLVTFITTELRPRSPAVNILKLVFWGVAIAIEIGTYVTTPLKRSVGAKKCASPMEERLSGLTIIVLGEALNSSIDPSVQAVKSIALNAKIGAQIFSFAMMVFTTYVLYVSVHSAALAATSSLRGRLAVAFHLPLQLFIILVAEGAKAVISITALNETLLWFQYQIYPFITSHRNIQTATQEVSFMFAAVGLDINALVKRIEPVLATPAGAVHDNELLIRLIAVLYQKAFSDYGYNDAEDELNTYAFSPNSDAPQDAIALTAGNLIAPRLVGIKQTIVLQEQTPFSWANAIAGAYLLALVVFTLVVNGFPHTRAVKWQIGVKIACGLAFIIWAAASTKMALLLYVVSGWYLPTIMLVYAFQCGIDYFWSRRAARRPRNEDAEKWHELRASEKRGAGPMSAQHGAREGEDESSPEDALMHSSSQ